MAGYDSLLALMQLWDNNIRNVRTWFLFSVTWKAFGFELDPTITKRLFEHLAESRKFVTDIFSAAQQMDSATSGPIAMYWLGRSVELSKKYTELENAFWQEAGRFLEEHGEKGFGNIFLPQ